MIHHNFNVDIDTPKELIRAKQILECIKSEKIDYDAEVKDLWFKKQ